MIFPPKADAPLAQKSPPKVGAHDKHGGWSEESSGLRTRLLLWPIFLSTYFKKTFLENPRHTAEGFRFYPHTYK